MMAKWLGLAFLILLLSQPLQADTADDAQVKQFVANSLLQTFSINGQAVQSNKQTVQAFYLDYAWQTMQDYLANYDNIAKNQLIQLHPYVQARPVIVKQGPVVVGIHYWLVNISIMIPELDDNLQCLVTVIHNPAVPKRPFAIQSISIEKSSSR